MSNGYPTNPAIGQSANGRVWDGSSWNCPALLLDAPADGNFYGRMNNTWQQVLPVNGGELQSLLIDYGLTVLGTTTLSSLNLNGALQATGVVDTGNLTVNGSQVVMGPGDSLVVYNQGVGGAIEAHDTGQGSDYCLQVYSELTGFLVGFWYGGGSNPEPQFATAAIVGTIESQDGVSTQYNTTSDARLKENEELFDPAPIIDALEPRRYTWRGRSKLLKTHGFMAQSVNEIYPEAVSRPRHADHPWMIDYSKFVPLLVAELKSLRIRVKGLEEQINRSGDTHART